MVSIDSNGMFQHQQPSGNTNNHSPNNHRHHHHHYHDEEAGGGPGSAKFGDYELSSGDPFDIPQTKNASLETLKRWRQAALVLNASRRFRYTLDLKREEEQGRRRRMIRSHAQVIRAAVLFKLAGENQIVIGPSATPSTPTGDYGIGLEQLVSITRDHSISALQEYGGVKGVSQLLKTNLEKGITEDETDLIKRKNSFGSNTYPQKKGRSFLRFLWEAWQDLTLIILIVAAVVSLALGIKTEGVKEGWYDGGSIAFAVFLVIIVTAVSDYRQSLQFQNLNDVKQNIQVELGMNFDLARSESMILQVFPFNSEKKRGGVAEKLVPFGDDDFDLAKRNDTAERLRKHLPPPFAGAGTISKDDVGHEVDNIEANGNPDMGNGDTGDSDDEYYKQVEQRRASRTSAGSSSPEPVDGNHQITYQMENIVSVEGRDGGATPDIDCGFDLTPHIGSTGGTTTVGIAFSQASSSVEGQEASSSGHNGGSGAGSGSDESDQSTGSGGTDTNEGRSRHVGGDEHDENDKDKGNDKDRRGASDLESGTRRVGNLSNMKLVAIFIAIIVASSCAIIDLSLVGLPPLARELFTGALVTNLVGFLCLHAALFPNCHINQRATEILVRVGGAAGAFGFLLMLGIRLSLRIIIPACLFVLAIFVLSFRQ